MENNLPQNGQLNPTEVGSRPKAEGAFIALAVGDALGWPQEIRSKGVHPRETIVKAEFSSWVRVERSRFYRYEQKIKPGEYSDDTQLMLAVARCRTLPTSAWWRVFTRTELPLWSLYQRGGGVSTKRAARSWISGVPPWEDKESDQVASYFNAGGNGVAMRVLPHAIYFAKKSDPAQLIYDIFLDGMSTHGHPRAIVGAVAYGFAAWWYLRARETIAFGEVIEVLLREIDSWGALPDISSPFESWVNAAATVFQGAYMNRWSEAVKEMLELLTAVKAGLDAGAISNDEAVLRHIGAYGPMKGAGTVTAAAALYLAARHAAQPTQGILRAAFGHGTDTDTIGAMVGGLVGCLAGNDWIPHEWLKVQDVEYIQRLADVVAQGQESELRISTTPIVVGNRELRSIRHALLGEEQTEIILDGVRRAKVVTVSEPQVLSKAFTTRTWSLRIEDGQTIFIGIRSPIPQESQQTQTKGQLGLTEAASTRVHHDHDNSSEEESRLQQLIRQGMAIAGGAGGSVASTVIGTLISGPEGAAIGGTIGTATAITLKAIGKELSARLLSPREQVRVGGVYALAAAEIIGRCQNGENVRSDEFFSTRDDGRSDAEEVWENTLLKSQREPEEKKLPYMAQFLANIAFDTRINAPMAHQITKAAEVMTYRQLCILLMSAQKNRFHLRTESYRGHQGFAKELYPIIYEYYDLYNRGLIHFGDTLVSALVDVNPGAATLQELGRDIYVQMGLHSIPDDDIVPIAEVLS